MKTKELPAYIASLEINRAGLAAEIGESDLFSAPVQAGIQRIALDEARHLEFTAASYYRRGYQVSTADNLQFQASQIRKHYGL